MSEIIEQNYRGIPIPTDEEFIALRVDQLDPGDDTPIPISDMQEYISEHYPAIGDVIAHDIRFWDKYESQNYDFTVDGENYSAEAEPEIDFMSGIEYGYLFFITTVTNLRFLRSDYKSIWHFVIDAPKNGSLPIISNEELARVKHVREGNAFVENNFDRDFVTDSGDLAIDDGINYVDEALWFQNLMQAELDEALEMLSDDDSPWNRSCAYAFGEGFRHGVHNAVEMYIQVDEERIIREMAADFGDLVD